METYRAEIIETQKARSDLLQQKLIINAVLGGIGLGLRGAGEDGASGLLNNHVYLILCLIPLVCVYIDLLCYHLNLRMFVIAKFLKDPRRAINKSRQGSNNKSQGSNDEDQNNYKNNLDLEDYRLYEKICSEERDAFSLESFALKASSIVLSLLLIILPFFIELDTINPLLDDICLSISGIVGIMLAMHIESLSNTKSNFLNFNEQNIGSDKNKVYWWEKFSTWVESLSNQNLVHPDSNEQNSDSDSDKEENNKLDKEYKGYLERLSKIGTQSKIAMYLQNILIFYIAIFLIVCSLYINSIIQNRSHNAIFFDISSNLHIAKFGFRIAILVMVVFCIGLLCLSITIYRGFKDLSKFTNNSSSGNRFYRFLIEKSAKIKLTDLKKEAIKDAIYSTFLISILMILCIIFLVFLDSNFEDTTKNMFYSIENYDVNSEYAKTLGNSLGLLGALFIGVSTLTSFFRNCFACYVNDIYKLKSFLPKELGKIEEEFVAIIPKKETNSNYPIEFSKVGTQNKIVPEKSKAENKQGATKQEKFKSEEQQNTSLLLIKCSDGIAIVNPDGYFVSSNDVIVEVNNTLNQDNLQTGNYWEIGFDFPIIIVTSELKEENVVFQGQEQKHRYKKYKFQNWNKITPEVADEKNGNGIEIGEETALFFVYTD